MISIRLPPSHPIIDQLEHSWLKYIVLSDAERVIYDQLDSNYPEVSWAVEWTVFGTPTLTANFNTEEECVISRLKYEF